MASTGTVNCDSGTRNTAVTTSVARTSVDDVGCNVFNRERDAQGDGPARPKQLPQLLHHCTVPTSAHVRFGGCPHRGRHARWPGEQQDKGQRHAPLPWLSESLRNGNGNDAEACCCCELVFVASLALSVQGHSGPSCLSHNDGFCRGGTKSVSGSTCTCSCPNGGQVHISGPKRGSCDGGLTIADCRRGTGNVRKQWHAARRRAAHPLHPTTASLHPLGVFLGRLTRHNLFRHLCAAFWSKKACKVAFPLTFLFSLSLSLFLFTHTRTHAHTHSTAVPFHVRRLPVSSVSKMGRIKGQTPP